MRIILAAARRYCAWQPPTIVHEEEPFFQETYRMGILALSLGLWPYLPNFCLVCNPQPFQVFLFGLKPNHL